MDTMAARRFVILFILLILAFSISAYVYNNHLTQEITFNSIPVDEEAIVGSKYLKEKETINILVIDGGGIRGMIPLYVLQHIEEKTGKPIDELFDIFAGVSTGAIIATGLNIPSEKLHKQYGDYKSKTDLLIQLYMSQSKYLFSSPWYHKLLTGAGLFSPRFLGDRLHDVMQSHYGSELTFTELENYVIIPTLDIHTGKIHLFKNRGNEITNLPSNRLYQLVTAATSAETIFPPVDFMISDKDIRHRYFADAGISANNPTSLVLRNVIEEFPDKKYYILILGAGTSPLSSVTTTYGQLKNWGQMRWIQDIITNVQRSMDKQQVYTLQIAKMLAPKGKIEYDYLNIKVTDPEVDMFDYKSIDSLKIHANRLINENSSKIDMVIKHLEQEKK